MGEDVVSSTDEPIYSEREFLERLTLSPMMVGRAVLRTEAMFLPENHPLLQIANNTLGIQGRVIGSLDVLGLTRLELSIDLSTADGDALVASIMTDHAASPILEEVSKPMELPGGSR